MQTFPSCRAVLLDSEDHLGTKEEGILPKDSQGLHTVLLTGRDQ